VKIRLYEAIILSTLLYGADVRPLTATLTKRLEEEEAYWQKSILGITWNDRIIDIEVKTRTAQQTMDKILRERRYAGLDMFCLWTNPSAHTTASTVLAGTRI